MNGVRERLGLAPPDGDLFLFFSSWWVCFWCLLVCWGVYEPLYVLVNMPTA